MNPPSHPNIQRRPDTEEPSEWLSSNLGSNSEDEEGAEEDGHDSGQLQGHFTSSDLLNPSDALDLLAHVADMEPDGHDHGQTQEECGRTEHRTSVAGASHGACSYPPIESGALTLSEASFLIEQ